MANTETPHERESSSSDAQRRRAARLYGLVVTGAVLAAAPDEYRLGRVALVLLGTLLVYWAAETYVHWIAARTRLQRLLHPDERRQVARDGWPLVAACSVPLLFLVLEALLQVETRVALQITLAVNAALLFAEGWRMSKAGGLTGLELLLSVGVSGLLGLVLVALKSGLH